MVTTVRRTTNHSLIRSHGKLSIGSDWAGLADSSRLHLVIMLATWSQSARYTAHCQCQCQCRCRRPARILLALLPRICMGVRPKKIVNGDDMCAHRGWRLMLVMIVYQRIYVYISPPFRPCWTELERRNLETLYLRYVYTYLRYLASYLATTCSTATTTLRRNRYERIPQAIIRWTNCHSRRYIWIMHLKIPGASRASVLAEQDQACCAYGWGHLYISTYRSYLYFWVSSVFGFWWNDGILKLWNSASRIWEGRAIILPLGHFLLLPV
jgi:hypothetical protein